MNYSILAVLALLFGLLGFWLHAIFFHNTRKIQSLSERNMILLEVLGMKEKEAKNLREKMIRSGTQADMLEKQLRQRNAELNDLYRGALLSDERIALLERTIAEASPTPNGTKDYSGIPEIPVNVSNPDISDPNGTAETVGELVRLKAKEKLTCRREEPLWRKKLNTILDVLKEMEK